VSALKCFDQLPHFRRVRWMSHFMIVKVCVIYTTPFATQNTTTVIAQFCMGHTAMKQKVWGDLTVHTHTSSHDNSTTFFSDSKLKMKKQGSLTSTQVCTTIT